MFISFFTGVLYEEICFVCSVGCALHGNRVRPLQYKFDFALWTIEIVRQLILREFGVKLSIDFLKRLIHGQEQPIFLIVDGHPMHKSKMVKKFVESVEGKLRLFLFPGYSPIYGHYRARKLLSSIYLRSRLCNILCVVSYENISKS
jgi:hypothetical protein